VTEGKNKAAILTEISLILAAIFWGTNYAATKFAVLSIPPLSIVAFRFVVGGLLMYAIVRILEPGSRPGVRTYSVWPGWAASGWSSPKRHSPSG